ncbi:MAG: hypothetical protein GX095_04655 [Clostridiales bacterium]|nr:hypothetical protein [Clostridiales bacterium]
MKKNWFLRIGLISLVLALATTCLLGGTFAKYTTTVSGSDSIQVAKFAFKATDGGIELKNGGAVINLFDDAKTDATGTVQTGMFAPGVYGTFSIVLDNTGSDVDVVINDDSEVDIILSASDEAAFDPNTAFIKFVVSYEPIGEEPAYGAVASLNDLAAAVEAAIELDEGDYIEKGSAVTIYVAYIWEGATDAVDSAIGTFAAAHAPLTITMDITIIADQKIA